MNHPRLGSPPGALPCGGGARRLWRVGGGALVLALCSPALAQAPPDASASAPPTPSAAPSAAPVSPSAEARPDDP
ncbi:MAG: hypothetical protein AAGA56_23120, partial [Myxococcota bacterium]